VLRTRSQLGTTQGSEELDKSIEKNLYFSIFYSVINYGEVLRAQGAGI